MKNISLILAIFFLITGIVGVFRLAEGIMERGWNGVNYGLVIFPLLISGYFFRRHSSQHKKPSAS